MKRINDFTIIHKRFQYNGINHFMSLLDNLIEDDLLDGSSRLITQL